LAFQWGVGVLYGTAGEAHSQQGVPAVLPVRGLLWDFLWGKGTSRTEVGVLPVRGSLKAFLWGMGILCGTDAEAHSQQGVPAVLPVLGLLWDFPWGMGYTL